MCGIAGFELHHDASRVAAALLGSLANRGPDGGWFTKVHPYGLVQTRLAVIDLSERVRYPLRNESGDLHLLFNGEIYGYEAHRDVLQSRGHTFSTRCDAEVLLHGYEEWGERVFERLDGMFAVALLDRRTGELVLARDALGIKPLVYTSSSPFAFSSDAVGLVAGGLSDGRVDLDAIGEYLLFHYITAPRTGLHGVLQLAPGELLRRSADGALAVSRWRPRPFSAPADRELMGVAELERRFDGSVKRQLVADVPVGVFLSSGIDSSLVLDSAVRSGARPMAFTIGFPGQGDYDETTVATRLTSELGVQHVVGELAGGFVETLSMVSRGFDQPLADASAIATSQLALLARQHVTVALSGTGGDDLFAGYYRHRIHRLATLTSRIPASVMRALAHLPQVRGAERQSPVALAISYLRRLASVSATNGFEQYLGLLDAAQGREGPQSLLLQPVATPPERARAAADLSEASSILRRIQAFELATYLPGDLLPKEDRMTMAAGLEARVPLLGCELLELAERSADRQKVSLRAGKLMLRDIARRRLPGYVARGRKRGFAVPLAGLFAGSWRNEAREWFEAASSSLLDVSRAGSLMAAGSLPPTDAWSIAMLVEWERRVADAARQAMATDSVGVRSQLERPSE